jgi:hypothetical protein
VGVGEVGFQPDRRAISGDCRLQLPLSPQRIAEVEVGQVEVGPEPDRRAARGDRLIQLTLGDQGVTQVVVAMEQKTGARAGPPGETNALTWSPLWLPWSLR